MCDHRDSPRLYDDPEDVCIACNGWGCRRIWDADCGDTFNPCAACCSIATVGVYVVRLHVGRIQFEQRWHSFGFELATARADRWAQLCRYFFRRFAQPGAEVRVLFKPTDPDHAEEDVYAVAVWSHQPQRAA